LLFDDKGNQLSPTHTRKKNRRYKYYVNQALLQFKKTGENAVTRVPAENIENIIEKQLLNFLTNDSKLTRTSVSIFYQTNHLINALFETDSYNNIEIYNHE